MKYWKIKIFEILLGLIIVFLSVTPTSAASLSFESNVETFDIGCSYDIDIYTNTGNVETNAVDAIINFDSDLVSFTDSADQLNISTTSDFELYLGSDITTDQITFTTATDTVKSGKLHVARLHMETLASGSGDLAFEVDTFDRFSSTDSNVVDLADGYDALTSTSDFNYQINEINCSDTNDAPGIELLAPTDTLEVQIDTDLLFELNDQVGGININTLELIVNGNTFTSESSEISYTGSPSSYEVTFNNPNLFLEEGLNNVIVNISDYNGASSSENFPFGVIYTTVEVEVPVEVPIEVPGEEPDPNSPPEVEITGLDNTIEYEPSSEIPITLELSDDSEIDIKRSYLSFDGRRIFISDLVDESSSQISLPYTLELDKSTTINLIGYDDEGSSSATSEFINISKVTKQKDDSLFCIDRNSSLLSRTASCAQLDAVDGFNLPSLLGLSDERINFKVLDLLLLIPLIYISFKLLKFINTYLRLAILSRNVIQDNIVTRHGKGQILLILDGTKLKTAFNYRSIKSNEIIESYSLNSEYANVENDSSGLKRLRITILVFKILLFSGLSVLAFYSIINYGVSGYNLIYLFTSLVYVGLTFGEYSE